MYKTAYKVALIVAGQIWSRHLQALAKITIPISIEVVGRSTQSLTKAKEHYHQISGNGFVNSVNFYQSLSELSDVIDIGIIVTNADNRRKVI